MCVCVCVCVTGAHCLSVGGVDPMISSHMNGGCLCHWLWSCNCLAVNHVSSTCLWGVGRHSRSSMLYCLCFWTRTDVVVTCNWFHLHAIVYSFLCLKLKWVLFDWLCFVSMSLSFTRILTHATPPGIQGPVQPQRPHVSEECLLRYT